MFSQLIIILLMVLALYTYSRHIKYQNQKAVSRLNDEQTRLHNIRDDFTLLIQKISEKEEKHHNILRLYEINRKVAHLLDIEKIPKVFLEELLRIRNITDAYFSGQQPEPKMKEKDYSCFCLKTDDKKSYLNIQCKDPDLKSQLPYLISQYKLLTDRAKIYKRLQKISITDTLTGTANKQHFLQRYEEEFNRSRKFGFELSFLMVDIDYFKKYNDEHGHLVGDEILREISGILKENVREIDFLGRFGGEEFSIFLPQTDIEQAKSVAERLRRTVEKYQFEVYDEKIKLTISIGAAAFPNNTRSKNRLIDLADKSLYKAKQTGRNRVCTV